MSMFVFDIAFHLMELSIDHIFRVIIFLTNLLDCVSFFRTCTFFFVVGQERFGNMTRVYYKEAVGAFIVFDVTRSATFDAVIKWKQDLDSKVQLPNGSPIPCILIANKVEPLQFDAMH